MSVPHVLLFLWRSCSNESLTVKTRVICKCSVKLWTLLQSWACYCCFEGGKSQSQWKTRSIMLKSILSMEVQLKKLKIWHSFPAWLNTSCFINTPNNSTQWAHHRTDPNPMGLRVLRLRSPMTAKNRSRKQHVSGLSESGTSALPKTPDFESPQPSFPSHL